MPSKCVAKIGALSLVVFAFFNGFASQPLFAATEKTTEKTIEKPIEKTTAKTTAKTTKKTTEVSFEDVLVQGKYHFSDEAVTTVEEDKVLDALLGVRKDFQDRIKKSAERF